MEDAGAAAPISTLSRLALKDAILELEIAARKTKDASTSAVLQLRQRAEQKLGLEVEIADPAMRSLFEEHVLKVDELLLEVRRQATATLEAVQLWSSPQLKPTAAGLRLLSDCDFGDNSAPGLEITADLDDADAAGAQARERCNARLAAEVFAPLDQRLHGHEQIREAIRQRQRCASFATSARMDVASLRKGEVSGSGLKALSGSSSLGPLEEAEARLKDDMHKAAALDEQILVQLTELKATSVECVKMPMAALIQIQAEYFMAQQVAWASLGEAFDDYGGLASVRVV